MGKTLADGYLEIRPDLKKLGPDFRRGIRAVNFAQHGREAGKQLGDGMAKGFGDSSSTFVKVAASMAARATIATGAFAALTPVVAKFTAAAAPAGGAIVALPAALAAAAAASSTFKVAVSGVSDAISKGLYGTAKQYNEALDDLPPAAQQVTKAVVGLKGQIQSLRQAVAQKFFAPLLDDLKPLTSTYVPLLGQEMGGLSAHLGEFGSEIARVARTSVVMQAVRDVFQQTGTNVDVLKGAVEPVSTALAKLVSSTMPLLTGMSQGVVTLSQRFAAWVGEASKTGVLVTIWNSAVTTIKDLWAIFGNLASIVRDVFSYSNTNAGTLLGTLRELTTQARIWVDSSQGARALGDIFRQLAGFGDTMRTTLAGVLPNIVESIRLAAPATSLLAAALGDTLVQLAPILPALTGVTVELVTAMIPALTSFAGWLRDNQGLLRDLAPYIVGVTTAIVGYRIAVAAAEVATRLWAVATGIAKGAVAAWTAVNWLAVAPVHAHNAALLASQSMIGTWIGVKALEAGAWLRSTAATVGNTTASVANRVATGVSTGVTAAFTAVKSLELGAWLRSTAAMVASTAGLVGQRIAMLAGAAATGVVTAAQWLWNAALTANPIGIVVVAIGALVAGLIYAYNHSETFRKIVNGVWTSVKLAISQVVDWFVGTAWPWLKKAWEAIQSGFNTLRDAVSAAWTWIKDRIETNWLIIQIVFNLIKYFITQVIPNAFRDGINWVLQHWEYLKAGVKATWDWIRTNVFDPIKNFITQTIPNAFRSGVDAIRNAWGMVQDAAKTPVAFVVNQVINPLIRGFNTVAGVFGIKPVGTITGFALGGQIPGYASGGRIPGAPSAVDNRLAVGPGGPIKVASGEFIVNARDTAKALPLLRWVNAGMAGGARTVAKYLGKPLSDTPGDGSEGWAFAGGGRIPGYASGGLVGFLSDVWGAITNPSKLIAAPIEAAMSGIPGSGLIKDFVLGMGRKLIGGLTSFLTGQTSGAAQGTAGAAQAFLRAQAGKPYIWASAGPGGYDCSGIVSAAWNILHGQQPYSHTFSTGDLPGRFFAKPGMGGVLTAGWSHPGQSPAGPGTGHMAGQLLGMPFESRGSRGVIVGSGARRVNEFAHIGHFARGGLIPRLFDTGGVLAPGLNLLNNATGGRERLERTDDLVSVVRELITVNAQQLTALQSLARELADALAGNTRRALQLSRGRAVLTATGQVV